MRRAPTSEMPGPRRSCGSTVPEESRFCLQCGRPVAGGSPGATPLERARPSLRMPAPLTLVALAVAVGGVILLVGGVFAWGVVALLGAAVLVLLPGRVDRAGLLDTRRRVEALHESLRVRGRGQVEVYRTRRELAELEAERGRLFHDLGRAVYGEDEVGTTAARTALAAVDKRVRTKEAHIETLIQETEERVRRVRGRLGGAGSMVHRARALSWRG